MPGQVAAGVNSLVWYPCHIQKTASHSTPTDPSAFSSTMVSEP